MGPSDADLELLLQSAVGAWPIDADRLAAFMAKATREAKLRTSWTDPDPGYDAAVERLVRGALGDPSFVAALERVVEELVEPGRRAALAQLALQLTVPGVPDIYRGSEAWDLSLVDPDNRRPVAFERLRALLATAREVDAVAAWADPDAGLPKLWLLARLLDLRRRRPDAFERGGYRPLEAAGVMADALVAFVRGDEVVTVVPRLVRRVAREGWADMTLALPPGAWRGLDDVVRTGVVPVADLVAAFPVAVLERER
jgi:(1->4)-alpha-D-glucan 1-alpha-D-glucosylmutase